MKKHILLSVFFSYNHVGNNTISSMKILNVEDTLKVDLMDINNISQQKVSVMNTIGSALTTTIDFTLSYRKRFLFLFLFLNYFICAFAQQYKVLIKEDFGTGTAEPSLSPASLIAPGTTNYTPQTSTTSDTGDTHSLRDGFYAVALNPDHFDHFGNFADTWQDGGDHTTGSGYMMIINANPAKQGEANGAYYLYSTSVFDIPGAQYDIDFWAANLIRYDFSSDRFKNGYVGLQVRNTSNNSGVSYVPSGTTNTWVLPKSTAGTTNDIPWRNYAVSFTLPPTYASNTPLYFNFYNTDTNSSTFGNDLALDDITIKMRVITFSGKIFNDVNSNGIQDPLEAGINGIQSPLYIYVVKDDGTIIDKVQVGADGSYTFTQDNGVPFSPYNIGLKTIVSSQNLNVGGHITTSVITDRITVSENVNGSVLVNTGLIDGIIALNSSTSDIANINIGIKALCYRPAVLTGTVLDSNFGITSLGRAGNNSWPMVRKGAHIVLESKTKGFVINRLTASKITDIPAGNLIDGMLVYDTTSKCLKIYVVDTSVPANTGWFCFNQQTCPD